MNEIVSHQKLVPILDRYQLSMPIECPFHESRDLLWWPNDDNIQSSPDYLADYGLSDSWLCPYCGRRFICSEKLSIHWDESHRPSVDQSQDSVCLADYCDIMRCDVINTVLMKRRQHRRQHESSSMSVETDKSDVDKFCNQSHMESLRGRCFATVKKCTEPLISQNQITDDELSRLEADISKEICALHTCENEKQPPMQRKRVSTSVGIVISVLMIGGFFICYYIVWMLFESPLQAKSQKLSVKHDSIQDSLKCQTSEMTTGAIYNRSQQLSANQVANTSSHYRYHNLSNDDDHRQPMIYYIDDHTRYYKPTNTYQQYYQQYQNQYHHRYYPSGTHRTRIMVTQNSSSVNARHRSSSSQSARNNQQAAITTMNPAVTNKRPQDEYKRYESCPESANRQPRHVTNYPSVGIYKQPRPMKRSSTTVDESCRSMPLESANTDQRITYQTLSKSRIASKSQPPSSPQSPRPPSTQSTPYRSNHM